MTGYWLSSFCATLWTSILFQSINMQEKKNLANIQPSWPHTWSTTHIRSLSPQARIQGRWNGWIFTPLFLSPLLSFLFSYLLNIETIFDFSDIITKIHPPFQNPGSALVPTYIDFWLNALKATCTAKAPAVYLLKLNFLRDAKPAFLPLKSMARAPVIFIWESPPRLSNVLKYLYAQNAQGV